jgi:ketosteroid isomerase-like protein
LTDLTGKVQELLDRQAISDVLHRYARGIGRHDVDLVESCYYPDAIEDHGFYVGPGRGVAERANLDHQDLLRHQHHITTNVVDLDGDTAHAETYYFVVMRGKSGLTNLVSGRYISRLERRNDEWRIAARVVMVETNTQIPTADMEATDQLFASGTFDRSDLSYQRPLVVSRQSPDDPHPTPHTSPA